MKKKGKYALIGILLLVVGIFVITFNMRFQDGTFKNLWPTVLLVFGIILYLYYFSTKKKKNRLPVLFLGTFIAICSVFLFVLSFTSFSNMRVLWPGFLLALGLGILSLYFYGRRNKGVLAGALLLIALPIVIWIFYSLKSKYGLVIGVSLFILGAAFLTRGLIREIEISAVEKNVSVKYPQTDFENYE
jgi:uncharacterized membrane protein HdeD (DUF308 family)